MWDLSFLPRDWNPHPLCRNEGEVPTAPGRPWNLLSNLALTRALKLVPHKLPTSPETQITFQSSSLSLPRWQDHLSTLPAALLLRRLERNPRPSRNTLRYESSCLPLSYSTVDCTWPVWGSPIFTSEWKFGRGVAVGQVPHSRIS